MTSNVENGLAVVIMGVSGAGKSTIGNLLAKTLNCKFVDADDFHPVSNIEKMQRGIPLMDEDRIPWLESLRDVLRENMASRRNVVLGCSALLRRYREILRSADRNHALGSCSGTVKFVLLDVKAEVLASRLEKEQQKGSISCLLCCCSHN